MFIEEDKEDNKDNKDKEDNMDNEDNKDNEPKVLAQELLDRTWLEKGQWSIVLNRKKYR